ncbi:hypothetical protein HAHI6034_05840 [Hathewaya histolytica]|uniref:Uncharacterized protein n=1 Tax=Hathewaya histolytica TaxID=1498 RepID=A0A4U9RGS0_HATHI|nr:hypothetical protein [Hathewaya histolytica]VTQ89653.1 Uncharacterised protein [Hathewaya histolytica]
MLLDIYGRLKEILKTQQIKDLDKFLEYQYNSYISCSDIANHLNITYNEAKKIINILLENDILKMNFKVFCKCEIDINTQNIYESIEDIPEEICSNCEKGCSVLKNVIIVYKVIGSDVYGTNRI